MTPYTRPLHYIPQYWRYNYDWATDLRFDLGEGIENEGLVTYWT